MRLSRLLQERQLRHADPVPSRDDELVGEGAYLSMRSAKQAIGLSRIRMGAVLCILEESGAWRGKTGAKTFNRFLVEEGIEPKAARQYLEVGRGFVLEPGCAGQ